MFLLNVQPDQRRIISQDNIGSEDYKSTVGDWNLHLGDIIAWKNYPRI